MQTKPGKTWKCDHGKTYEYYFFSITDGKVLAFSFFDARNAGNPFLDLEKQKQMKIK